MNTTDGDASCTQPGVRAPSLRGCGGRGDGIGGTWNRRTTRASSTSSSAARAGRGDGAAAAAARRRSAAAAPRRVVEGEEEKEGGGDGGRVGLRWGGEGRRRWSSGRSAIPECTAIGEAGEARRAARYLMSDDVADMGRVRLRLLEAYFSRRLCRATRPRPRAGDGVWHANLGPATVRYNGPNTFCQPTK